MLPGQIQFLSSSESELKLNLKSARRRRWLAWSRCHSILATISPVAMQICQPQSHAQS